MEEEKPQFDVEAEGVDESLSSMEGMEPAELLSSADIEENAANAHQDIGRSHSIWRNISGEIAEYLEGREVEIGEVISELLKKQKQEREGILSGQEKDTEAVKLGTREKLQNFFSQILEQLSQAGKKALNIVPDAQKLIDSLGVGKELEVNPVGRNLMAVLNAAGGVRSYSVERGNINEDQENSGLRGLIVSVNKFLDENERTKVWLQDVIKMVVASQK